MNDVPAYRPNESFPTAGSSASLTWTMQLRQRTGVSGGRGEEGVVLDVSGEIPKSFVVCDHPYHRQIVYLSQLNSTTLQKRAESGNLE